MLQLRMLLPLCIALFFLQFSLEALAGIFRISEQEEIRIGSQAAAQVEKKNQVFSNAYLDKLGEKLVSQSGRSNISYRFRIINSKEINAFALPGGFIYINNGIIQSADSENEVVGVIAHEIGHVVAKHSVNQMERASKAQLGLSIAQIAFSRMRSGSTILNGAEMATQGVFLKFSRDQERQADRLGAENMYKAGWNPKGMISFFEKLAKKGGSNISFFSTHPSPKEREQNISDLVANWNTDGIINTKEFQNMKASLN